MLSGLTTVADQRSERREIAVNQFLSASLMWPG